MAVAASLPPEPAFFNPAAHPGARRRLATVAMMTGLVVSAFEGTVVTSAMPTIARELGGDRLYPWVFIGFLVAAAVSVPLFGKLADRLGRRPVYTAGMALFLVGSAMCGAVGSMAALVFWRVVQGLGVGAIGPLVPTISADIYTLEERAKVQALFTGSWGAANALGPLIGGWLVSFASWRWVFLVNVPFGLAAVALLLVSYVDPPRTHARDGAPLDVRGAAAFAAASTALLLAMERELDIGVATRAALFAAGMVVAWWLAGAQRRAASPLFPVAELRAPLARTGVVGSLFAGALMYAPPAYIPLWMAEERGASAIDAGAALVPMLLGWAAGSTCGVRFILHWGSLDVGRRGLALAAASLVAVAVAMHEGAPISVTLSVLAVVGFGLGAAGNALMLGPQAAVPWASRGAITSAVHAARTLGGSLGVALLNVVDDRAAAGGAAALRFVLLAALTVLGCVLIRERGGLSASTAEPAARRS